MRITIITLLLAAVAVTAEAQPEAPFTFEGEVLVQNASAFDELGGHVVCKVCRGPTCPPGARLEDTLRRPDDPSNPVVALGVAPLGSDPMRGGGDTSIPDEVVPFTVRIRDAMPPRYSKSWPVPLTEAETYVCYLELIDPAAEAPPRDERDFEAWGAPFVPTVGNPEPVRNAVGGAPMRVIASGPIP